MMQTKEQIIDLLTEKCESELDYYEIVNECAEKVEYRLIVELIVDTILEVWKEGKDAN